MRGRHQNGKQSGSALQQQGKSRHQQRRGLGVRHLLQLLVLLAAQQTFSVPEVKVVSTAMLKASTAVAGFLLAPQAAQAQAQAPVLTAQAGDKSVTLTWTWSGTRTSHAKWSYGIRPTGSGPSFPRTAIPGSTVSTRSYTITGLNNGSSYDFHVVGTTTSGVGLSGTLSNTVSATPSAPPVLISDADKSVRLASGESTVAVCYNLLSVSYDGTTYLEKRQSRTAVPANSALKDTTNGVSITEAPAVISAQVVGTGNVNFDPCATVGPGTHTVTWEWNGPDGTAPKGTTSTTVTVVAHNAKTITLSADSTTITEGDSGTKDVVLTVTLSEAAPAGGVRVSVPWLNSGTTATSNSNGADPCNPSAIGNANMDWCRTSGNTAVTIAEGQTKGTVTVKIVGDNRDESDETIRFGTQAPSGWTSFNSLTLTIKDDDGKKITLSADSTTITEGDSGRKEVTITATLGEPAPSGGTTQITTTIAPSSTATGGKTTVSSPCDNTESGNEEADFCWPSGSNFNFSAGQTQKTRKIAILSDSRDEEDETIILTVSSRTAGWVGANTLTLTIKDDDGAGVTISDETLTVTEGASTTYTVVLDTNPGAQVIVTPTSSPTAKATVSGALTFTTGNWDTAQTVTVTGVAAGAATVSHTVSGYSGVSSSDIEDVSVTVNAAKTITLSATSTSINEGDSGRTEVTITATYSEAAPVGGVLAIMNVDSSSTATAGNVGTPSGPCDNSVASNEEADYCWSAGQGVSAAEGRRQVTSILRILGDTRDEDDETIILTVSSRTAGWVGANTLTLTIKDDDGAGVTISDETLTVTEGASTTYTVVLDTNPGAQVIVTPTSSPTAKATVSGALTFTTGNWDTAQTVTVTGVAAGAATVSHTVSGYSGVSSSDIEDVSVTVNAAPTAGVTISKSALTVAEEGGTGTYTVVLDTEPTGNVTVTPSSGDTGAARVSPASLVFTTDNWDTARTVTVSGESDTDPRNETVTITNAVAGANYASVSADSVRVTVTDDDDPAAPVLTSATGNADGGITFTWTHPGGSGAGDYIAGATGFFSWEVNHRLRGSTSWAKIGGSNGSCTQYPDRLVCQTARTWTVGASTITYAGAGYSLKYPDGAALEVRIRAAGSKPNPRHPGSGLNVNIEGPWSNVRTATIKNAANKFPKVTGRPVTLTGVGATATYTVELGKTSTEIAGGATDYGLAGLAGTLSIVSANPDKATVSPPTLTFTAGNYSTTQTVTVTGVAVGAATINHSFRLTSASADAIPQGDTVKVAVGTLAPGVTLSRKTLAVTEAAGAGNSATYTVRLNTAPSATVTVTPTSGDPAVSVSGALTFTASNYNDEQIVTVTGVDDADTESETVTISHSASGDTTYGSSLSIETVSVTTTDNDTPTGGSGSGGSGSGGSSTSSAPSAPTGLRASAGNGQVTLSWSSPDNSTITKWQVQQKQGDGSYGPWVDIPNSTATTTSYTVTGLTNGMAYSLRIRAVNAGGNSPASAEVRATPLAPPVKPTGVTATAGHAQVTLSWDNPNNATISKWQYQQKQGDGSYGPWMDIPDSTASTTSHTVTGLSNGVTYSFRIRAVNAGGNGAPSDEVTVTPIDQDMVQADKARSQALAATSRTLLGMATDVLGARTGGDAPVALAGSGNTLGEQAMGVVENLLGINSSELPTSLTLEDVEDRLWSQSFQLTPPASGMGQEWNPSGVQQRSWAVWGAGELRSYRGNDDAEHLSYSGDMKTAWLGVDHQFTDRWMAGAALSFATGQSDYSYRKTDGSKDGGRMESRLTVVYPYGSFQASEGLRLWGMAGMGWGSQHHQQTGNDAKAEGDLRLQMGVIGFERSLSSIGELSLSLAGDAGLVKSTTEWKAGSGLDDLSVSLHRIRLGIDSSFPLAEHTTAYLNLKGRLDGGDLDMNAAEIVAGLHYSKERFSGFLQGRQTYAFDGSYAESALTAQLRFTARPDGTGLAWTLQPSYGNGNGDLALAAGPSLWTDEQLEALTGSNPSRSGEMALSSRVGYGIRLQTSDLLLTPFTEMRLSEAGSQHIGLGLTLEGNSWDVELSSSREKGANSSPTTKTELNFSKKL